MLRRFRHAIQEHYQERGYSPEILALAQGVSQRTVYTVFASAQSSFGRELASCRMERARQILDSAKFDNTSIAEICMMVGYFHPSHFITRFREAYGVAPFAYRAARHG